MAATAVEVPQEDFMTKKKFICSRSSSTSVLLFFLKK
jgi:hypothetical protein